VVLDQVAKQRRREGEFVRRVGVEEAVLVKETVQEAGKELVVVLVVRLFRLAQSGHDLVDRNLLLVHALVQRVALGLDLGREGGHGHAGLRVGVLRREVHQTRVELQALRANLLEELDVAAGEEFVTAGGLYVQYPSTRGSSIFRMKRLTEHAERA
jgi:hypothetical protein